MKRRFLLAVIALVPLAGVGCSKVQAKSAMKDGNKEYKEENFKRAIEHYSRAVEKDPGYAEAWFYLGSSNQALYRPGKDTSENKQYLEKAIESYKKSLENNQAGTANLQTVKVNTLGALTGIYSEDPFKDCPTAENYANTLVADHPDDPKNLYALANLQEKCNKIAEAEETYKKVESNTLAAYRQLVPEGQATPEEPASRRGVSFARVPGSRVRVEGVRRAGGVLQQAALGRHAAPSGPRPAARADARASTRRSTSCSAAPS